MRVDEKEAISLLLRGEVVALATETVYGLAASIKHEKAVEALFTLKGRPRKNPLIVHGAKKESLLPFMKELPALAEKLMDAFWPGPLTLVLPSYPTIPSIIRANLPTCAFRVPDEASTQRILQKTGPLVMPSCNLSGKPSSTTASHVEEDFGQKLPVVDSGPTKKGVESTILGFFDGSFHHLRHGAIPLALLEEVLGESIKPHLLQEGMILSPGQLEKHYRPEAKMHFLQDQKEKKQFPIVGFSDVSYPDGCTLFPMGSLQNPEECLVSFYRILRELDRKNIKEAFFDGRFPNKGLYLTLRERMERASGD